MNKSGDSDMIVTNYIDENGLDKIAKIIKGYTGVVNKMVGRK